MPHNEAELQAYLKEKGTELGSGSEVTAQLHVKPQKLYRISDKLIGIFFEDISRAADGGLCAELLQNGDFEYNGEKKGGMPLLPGWVLNFRLLPVIRMLLPESLQKMA